MMKFASIATFLLLLVPGGVSAASEHELSPLVVTATMTEQNFAVATGTVEVISSEDIARLGAEDVADVLRYATGLNLLTGTGRAKEVSIRGMGAGHTLILLDGRRITGGYNATVDVRQIPVVLIDHIEIVRGPGSALYGSEATGGVINIITKQAPKQTEAAIDARGAVGLAAEQNLQGMIGSGSGLLRAIIAAAHYEQDGWDKAGDPVQELDDLQQDSLFTRAAVDLAQGHELSVGGEWSKFQRDGTRYYMNAERMRKGEEERVGGFLQYRYQPDADYDAMFRVYGNQSEGSYRFSPVAPSSSSDENRRELLQIESRGSVSIAETLTLTAGGEMRWEALEGDQLDALSDDRKSERVSAVFGQFNWVPIPWFSLVGSLRFDDYRNSGNDLSPRLVASFYLPKGKVWASYGEGFRAASLDQFYGQVYKRQGKDLYLGNEDLDPETSRSAEAGIALHNDRLRGQLVYFYNRIEDLIDAELVSTASGKRTFEYQNVNKATTYGIELETGVTLTERLDLSAQGTWLQTENEESGEDLANEPEWKGDVALTWQIPLIEVEAQMRYLYFGTSEDGSGGKLDRYDLVSLSLTKQVTENLKIYAGSDNLFQEENDDYFQDPLEVYAGLTYRF